MKAPSIIDASTQLAVRIGTTPPRKPRGYVKGEQPVSAV